MVIKTLVRVIVLLFVVYLNFSIGFLYAHESKTPLENNKKYNFSICAVFKNEAKYLKEWIDYHRILGVDHFYLYNVGSTDHFKRVLRPYIREGLVTLINWPEAVSQDDNNDSRWALSTQVPAYENVVNFVAIHETKWLVLSNIDEFLECPEGEIRELLKKYDSYPGISLTSECFGALIPDTLSVKQRAVKSAEFADPINKSVAKMIFKPEHCRGFIWPPYKCRFQPNETSAEVDRDELRISRCINKKMRYPPLKKSNHS